jgi:hypothetical protein
MANKFSSLSLGFSVIGTPQGAKYYVKTTLASER